GSLRSVVSPGRCRALLSASVAPHLRDGLRATSLPVAGSVCGLRRPVPPASRAAGGEGDGLLLSLPVRCASGAGAGVGQYGRPSLPQAVSDVAGRGVPPGLVSTRAHHGCRDRRVSRCADASGAPRAQAVSRPRPTSSVARPGGQPGVGAVLALVPRPALD